MKNEQAYLELCKEILEHGTKKWIEQKQGQFHYLENK